MTSLSFLRRLNAAVDLCSALNPGPPQLLTQDAVMYGIDSAAARGAIVERSAP